MLGGLVILTENPNITKTRSFFVMDGWHRRCAMTELMNEFPGNPRFEQFPQATIIDDKKINVIMGAMSQNVITQTLAKVTYYDQIMFLRKLWDYWLANVSVKRKAVRQKFAEWCIENPDIRVTEKKASGMGVLVGIIIDLKEESLEYMQSKFDEDEEVLPFSYFFF